MAVRHELLPQRDVLRVAGVQLRRLLAARRHDRVVGRVLVVLVVGRVLDRACGRGRRAGPARGPGRRSKAASSRKLLVAVDEHAELRAPVAEVVVGDDRVAEEPQEAGERVADDRAAEVADVQRLRHVRAASSRSRTSAASRPARRRVSGRWRSRGPRVARNAGFRRRLMNPGPATVGGLEHVVRRAASR